MKTITKKYEHRGTAKPGYKSQIAQSRLMFEIISSKIYSREMLVTAVCRELACNAADSHVRAGKPQEPFDVWVDGEADAVTLHVRDYGVGMGVDEVPRAVDVGCSDKSESSETGILGLGLKVPYAITDQWTLTTFDGQQSRRYLRYVDPEDGVHVLSEPVVSDCDEPRGVQIDVPIEKIGDSQEQVLAKVRQVLEAFGHPGSPYRTTPRLDDKQVPAAYCRQDVEEEREAGQRAAAWSILRCRWGSREAFAADSMLRGVPEEVFIRHHVTAGEGDMDAEHRRFLPRHTSYHSTPGIQKAYQVGLAEQLDHGELFERYCDWSGSGKVYLGNIRYPGLDWIRLENFVSSAGQLIKDFFVKSLDPGVAIPHPGQVLRRDESETYLPLFDAVEGYLGFAVAAIQRLEEQVSTQKTKTRYVCYVDVDGILVAATNVLTFLLQNKFFVCDFYLPMELPDGSPLPIDFTPGREALSLSDDGYRYFLRKLVATYAAVRGNIRAGLLSWLNQSEATPGSLVAEFHQSRWLQAVSRYDSWVSSQFHASLLNRMQEQTGIDLREPIDKHLPIARRGSNYETPFTLSVYAGGDEATPYRQVGLFAYEHFDSSQARQAAGLPMEDQRRGSSPRFLRLIDLLCLFSEDFDPHRQRMRKVRKRDRQQDLFEGRLGQPAFVMLRDPSHPYSEQAGRALEESRRDLNLACSNSRYGWVLSVAAKDFDQAEAFLKRLGVPQVLRTSPRKTEKGEAPPKPRERYTPLLEYNTWASTPTDFWSKAKDSPYASPRPVYVPLIGYDYLLSETHDTSQLEPAFRYPRAPERLKELVRYCCNHLNLKVHGVRKSALSNPQLVGMASLWQVLREYIDEHAAAIEVAYEFYRIPYLVGDKYTCWDPRQWTQADRLRWRRDSLFGQTVAKHLRELRAKAGCGADQWLHLALLCDHYETATLRPPLPTLDKPLRNTSVSDRLRDGQWVAELVEHYQIGPNQLQFKSDGGTALWSEAMAAYLLVRDRQAAAWKKAYAEIEAAQE